MLSTGDSVKAVLPGILEAIRQELDGEECALWLVAPGERPRCAGLVGRTRLDADAIAAYLEAGQAVEGVVAARLLAGQRVLGALVVRPARALSGEDRLFLSTVADVLAPTLRDAEYAHRLEVEVVERTIDIEAQRRFTAMIIDSLPLGLYVIDREYRIQAWNRKRETGMQGVSRDEALGRTIFQILHRQPAELLRREFDDVFATGRVQQFQMESNASGETRTYRITKIPMRLDDAAVTHVITIGEDITEWRDAQERFAQAEKLAAIGTLAAGVMHEINNPLATIGACAEGLALRLQEGEPASGMAGDLLEAFRLIEHEVQRCKSIVGGVLDFSRPKQLARAPLDVNTVIEKTLFLLKHHTRFKRLTVRVEPGRDLPCVIASEEQLIQVFMSLLLNAMDATQDSGTVVLRTQASRPHPGTGAAVIAEVIDDGQGIRGAELGKIFEPFYTTKPPGRGTGLGLSICYGILSEHGGSIAVDSTVGKGSVFRIVLPAATPAAIAEYSADAGRLA